MNPFEFDLAHVTFRLLTDPAYDFVGTRPLGHVLGSHVVLTDKRGGRGFSALIPRAGATRRGTASTGVVTAWIFDIDAVPSADFQRLLAHLADRGLAYAAYTTWSHTDELQCWRLVLLLSRPATPAEWDRLWSHLNERVCLGLADTGVKDAARLSFLPSCQAERKHLARILYGEGRPINVEVALAHVPLPPKPSPMPAIRGEGRARRYALAALRQEAAVVANAKDGERHQTLNVCVFKVATLVPLLEVDEIEWMFAIAARGCGLPDAEARRVIRAATRAGMAKPRAVPTEAA